MAEFKVSYHCPIKFDLTPDLHLTALINQKSVHTPQLKNKDVTLAMHTRIFFWNYCFVHTYYKDIIHVCESCTSCWFGDLPYLQKSCALYTTLLIFLECFMQFMTLCQIVFFCFLDLLPIPSSFLVQYYQCNTPNTCTTKLHYTLHLFANFLYNLENCF